MERDLCQQVADARPFVLADRAVWGNGTGARVLSALGPLDDSRQHLLTAGEGIKSIDAWRGVVEWMQDAGMRRHDVLVIVGGGSLTDLGGFAAATYLRGVPYINVPTTILSQADAAIGGKTAINSPAAKNALGAFHHPVAVVTDVTLLETLERRDVSAGLAECIKVSAAQRSGALFAYLTEHAELLLAKDGPSLMDVIGAAVEEKLRLLADDPFETDLARVLNFGHSVGHALESADQYRNWRHGEAVAIGMATAARTSALLGISDRETCRAFLRLLTRYGLPLSVPDALIDAVVEHLDGIRRVRGGMLRYVLPRTVGELVVLDEVDTEVLVRAMRERAAA
ncbi:3-dehydroquinate synthase [Streptomyces sp. MBT42]|uniref:3-dehydroquinate synthase family protein n=1 Tax=Streptomyces sp. MBT42 TaxID=1488373 RepID=UPI001E2EDC58|nr:3-dehydroquinate synthase family protein [Streptomyces sp. MBT42]MCD2468711.1 3-dehydroquinate synthase [Streptomyces sp. MBT42]